MATALCPVAPARPRLRSALFMAGALLATDTAGDTVLVTRDTVRLADGPNTTRRRLDNPGYALARLRALLTPTLED